MLIERNELDFDFGKAEFDLKSKRDLEFLGWVFNQFLYGEVTGIQCGYWLYRAPTLSAASFLARQAMEELSHVKRIRRIQTLLGCPAEKAHPAVRFLSTGMMGGSWGEHVCLEMALGEGLVLTAFYALARTLPHDEIRRTIESAILDEEKHVHFGEIETRKWLTQHPGDRDFLLSQALLQWLAMGWLKRSLSKKLEPSHPVLSKFDAFYSHTMEKFSRRCVLLQLSSVPLNEISWTKKLFLVATLPFRKMKRKWRFPATPLTETYLEDEWVSGRPYSTLPTEE